MRAGVCFTVRNAKNIVSATSGSSSHGHTAGRRSAVLAEVEGEGSGDMAARAYAGPPLPANTGLPKERAPKTRSSFAP